MTISILALTMAVLLLVFATSTDYFWRRCIRLERELASLAQDRDELAAILALEHETNYRLACQIHGRAAVDRAIREAHAKGVN